MKFFLLFIFFLNDLCANEVAPPSSIEAYQEEKNLDQLLLLIQKRLVIMHEVARTKWNLNLPIEDKEQEALILDQLVLKSESLGLDKNRIRLFFEAQIEAAKMIQKQDFAIWQRQDTPKFNTIIDLKTSLRPYIDSINQEMLYTSVFRKLVFIFACILAFKSGCIAPATWQALLRRRPC